MIKVNYEEWLKNVDNENWSGWKDVKHIESTVGKSRTCPDWFSHAICFLNNYLLEKKVKEFMKLDYLGDDHLEWREGKGDDIPDFVDLETATTYELKQMKDLDSLEQIPYYAWHKADVRLAYCRIEATLYQSTDKGKTWKSIARFTPRRIKYKELRIYEKICTKENEVCPEHGGHATYN